MLWIVGKLEVKLSVCAANRRGIYSYLEVKLRYKINMKIYETINGKSSPQRLPRKR